MHILSIQSIIIEILAKISCILAGPFLVFVIGCGIYSAVTGGWRNLLILLVIASVCILFYLLTGLMLGLIDIAAASISRFLRS